MQEKNERRVNMTLPSIGISYSTHRVSVRGRIATCARINVGSFARVVVSPSRFTALGRLIRMLWSSQSNPLPRKHYKGLQIEFSNDSVRACIPRVRACWKPPEGSGNTSVYSSLAPRDG